MHLVKLKTTPSFCNIQCSKCSGNKDCVGSLSGAIPDGKIPRDVFVCALAGSLCNM